MLLVVSRFTLSMHSYRRSMTCTPPPPHWSLSVTSMVREYRVDRLDPIQSCAMFNIAHIWKDCAVKSNFTYTARAYIGELQTNIENFTEIDHDPNTLRTGLKFLCSDFVIYLRSLSHIVQFAKLKLLPVFSTNPNSINMWIEWWFIICILHSGKVISWTEIRFACNIMQRPSPPNSCASFESTVFVHYSTT